MLWPLCVPPFREVADRRVFFVNKGLRALFVVHLLPPKWVAMYLVSDGYAPSLQLCDDLHGLRTFRQFKTVACEIERA